MKSKEQYKKRFMIFNFIKLILFLVPIFISGILFLISIEYNMKLTNIETIQSVNKVSVDSRKVEMYKKELKEENEKALEYIDKKVTLGISIVGIAITVWVALQIVSYIDKREVENIKELLEELRTKIARIDYNQGLVDDNIDKLRLMTNATVHILLESIEDYIEKNPKDIELITKKYDTIIELTESELFKYDDDLIKRIQISHVKAFFSGCIKEIDYDDEELLNIALYIKEEEPYDEEFNKKLVDSIKGYVTSSLD